MGTGQQKDQILKRGTFSPNLQLVGRKSSGDWIIITLDQEDADSIQVGKHILVPGGCCPREVMETPHRGPMHLFYWLFLSWILHKVVTEIRTMRQRVYSLALPLPLMSGLRELLWTEPAASMLILNTVRTGLNGWSQRIGWCQKKHTFGIRAVLKERHQILTPDISECDLIWKWVIADVFS